MKELEGLAEEGDSHEGGKNRDEVHEHPGPSRTDHLDAGDEVIHQPTSGDPSKIDIFVFFQFSEKYPVASGVSGLETGEITKVG